jgi:hypothetical protein
MNTPPAMRKLGPKLESRIQATANTNAATIDALSNGMTRTYLKIAKHV